MRTLDEIVERIEKRGKKVTRQDISDLKSLYLADNAPKLREAVKKHFGKYLTGEKRGKQALQAVLEDVDSYVK
jgi:hypothetical protein